MVAFLNRSGNGVHRSKLFPEYCEPCGEQYRKTKCVTCGSQLTVHEGMSHTFVPQPDFEMGTLRSFDAFKAAVDAHHSDGGVPALGPQWTWCTICHMQKDEHGPMFVHEYTPRPPGVF